MTRTVSVIIPTYNYGRFVAGAIESALGQTCPSVEVIVVDDGSTDDTAEVVGKFGERVRYLRQENSGVGAARNRGVAEAVGEFIAFLDADDTWEPTKLEKQLAVFERDPEVGLVHCGMREFDSETGGTVATHVDGQAGWVADELLLWERPAIIGPGGTIMVRRDAFEAVGGFDERMRVSEDWDFCYRVARRYKVGFVAEPLVNYRSHPAAAHRDVSELERGMSRFYQKAFAEGDVPAELKDRAIGNFHRTLAGSYFHSGEYGRFIEHASKSIFYRPSAIGYFLRFPLRRWRNKRI